MLVLTLFAGPAWATTLVEITSGHIRGSAFGLEFEPIIRLEGPGFLTGTHLGAGGGFVHFIHLLSKASHGQTFNMSVPNGRLIHSTIGVVIRDDEPLIFTMQAVPFTIDLTVFDYRTPFTFAGSLVQDGQTTLFSGHGIASVLLDPSHFVDRFSYDFLSTSIPEPATWLLLLAGVPILWWRHYAHVSTRSTATEVISDHV